MKKDIVALAFLTTFFVFPSWAMDFDANLGKDYEKCSCYIKKSK